MIIVIGKQGQLAWELAQLTDASELVCLGRDDIDITSPTSIEDTLGAYSATAIINASAYTAVDKAETDSDNAFFINATAVTNLAYYAKQHDLHFVHVSTDYVFAGDKGSPYLVDDAKAPTGVYGASKSQGEDEIMAICPEQAAIIRTSWVYSSHGNNFVKTMLRLMAEKPQLGVIDDQIGSPTWARGLAEACLYAATNRVCGIHHWTDSGVASWYDFAVMIQRLAIEKGLLKVAVPVLPIGTKDYPTPAKRPHYSVLDKASLAGQFRDVKRRHWVDALNCMLDQLKPD